VESQSEIRMAQRVLQSVSKIDRAAFRIPKARELGNAESYRLAGLGACYSSKQPRSLMTICGTRSCTTWPRIARLHTNGPTARLDEVAYSELRLRTP
jgi:hypothetical protein